MTRAGVPPEERKSAEPDRRLRRIARAGKQWKRTVGRTLDMEGELFHSLFFRLLIYFFYSSPAYVYRLCLEWARLWADERASMNFML